jgi:hypothetical protein
LTAHPFDPGPVSEPFASLAKAYPGSDVYPAASFRLEWGPIFHRGRLDGSAKVLVIGQDPAASEAITRRILVGEAGHRVQGFLAKLGVRHSYVMVNTFLYSVYGQQSGERHIEDPQIAAYRNKWLDGLLSASGVEVVIALGHLADRAFAGWRARAPDRAVELAYAHVTHPTQPESSSGGNATKLAAATTRMLADWNQALEHLRPKLKHPDVRVGPNPYGSAFKSGERLEIPEGDLPPGLPAWMRSPNAWAQRTGPDAGTKRATITVAMPPPWPWS